jgi:hypothetical protein
MKKIQFNTMGPEHDLFRKMNCSVQTSQAAPINNSSPGITRVHSLKEMLLHGLLCDGDYIVSNYWTLPRTTDENHEKCNEQ